MGQPIKFINKETNKNLGESWKGLIHLLLFSLLYCKLNKGFSFLFSGWGFSPGLVLYSRPMLYFQGLWRKQISYCLLSLKALILTIKTMTCQSGYAGSVVYGTQAYQIIICKQKNIGLCMI